MDNTTAKLSCFARAYHFENNESPIFADRMEKRFWGGKTKVNKTLASGAGEQMKAQYSYEEMAALLSECGFRAAEHLTAEKMTKLYFADYNKHTPGHPMSAPSGVDYIFAVRE